MAERKLRVQLKKNLVIATDCYLPRRDGIAKFLDDIIPKLKPKFNITVIAPKYEGKHKPLAGITEIRLPLQNLKIADYPISSFDSKLVKNAIKLADLVWTHSITPTAVGQNVMNMAKKYRKKVVSYVHSVEWELVSRALGRPLIYKPVSLIVRAYTKHLYRKSDLLMMPSYSTLNLFNWYKIKTKKIIASLGVDAKKYTPPENKAKAKSKVKLDPSWTIIGYTGRIVHEKDLKTLVRAFLRLRDNYPDLRLMMVGTGLKELEHRFEKINGIIMVGEKTNVVPYLQAMDIYVLSSLTETTSLSTLEAMSTGIPVVVTPVGEIKNYIKNNKNGFKFPKGNSFELSHYLRRLIDDPKLRARLGTNARKTVIEDYSWESASDNIVEQLVDLAY